MIKILTGDNRLILPTLPDKSVQCVVTSPPYFNLRDYQTEGQIGLEAVHDCLGWATGRECGKCYVCEIVGVFRQVWRVLRDDGVLWLNLGDSFATQGGSRQYGSHDGGTGRAAAVGGNRQAPNRLKPKDLFGIPWRVALALQADGWYLRMDCIWAKPSPMPESVTDRPTKAHEYLFLLAKSERYFYDAEAIKEPITESSINRQKYGWNGVTDDGSGGARSGATFKRLASSGSAMATMYGNLRNKRSVWTVPAVGFTDAHFAVFPPDLIEPCIKAGTSERGACPQCGSPYRRVVEKSEPEAYPSNPNPVLPYVANGVSNNGTGATTLHMMRETKTVDWRLSCKCDAGEPVPCVVLDPFSGAGTTGLVADRLGCDAILIELNPAYVEIAQKRLQNDAPLLARVQVDAPLLAYAANGKHEETNK